MKVLITGANGFIGSNLTRELAQRGEDVTAFILKGTNFENIKPYVKDALQGDITDEADCAKACKGAEVVYHLAAIASDYITLEQALWVNSKGTEKMVNAAAEAGAKRFVLVSSLAVHHFSGYNSGDESAPRDGHLTPYSYSKIKAEDAVSKCCEKKRIETAIVRPGVFPFGPGDYTSFFHLARALERGIYAHVNGGKALLCTAYVENLCEGIILCGTHEKASGETFIISDDEPITWKELIAAFCRELNIEEPKRSVPYLAVMPLAMAMEAGYRALGVKKSPPLTPYRVSLPSRDFYFTNEKAKRLLGYNPKIKLEESVKRTAEWYLSVKGA